MPDKPLVRVLTNAEYEALSLQDRMDYLMRLMADIRQKMEENRWRIAETNRRLSSPDADNAE